MDRELDLRRSIELGRQKLESIEKLPDGAIVLSDEWLNAVIVLDDLESELNNLLDNPPEHWSASVGAALQPPPHFNSGAIALPEPEEI
jgi:hypothetical protein